MLFVFDRSLGSLEDESQELPGGGMPGRVTGSSRTLDTGEWRESRARPMFVRGIPLCVSVETHVGLCHEHAACLFVS